MVRHNVCWTKLGDMSCKPVYFWTGFQLACIQSCTNSIATNISVSLTGPQTLNLQFWLLDGLCLALAHDQLLRLPWLAPFLAFLAQVHV